MRRRTFLEQLIALPALGAFGQAPAIITSNKSRPVIDASLAAGPRGDDGAIIWAHVDRPGRLVVEYSTTSSFSSIKRVRGTTATADTGLTARALIGDLRAGQDIFYRARFEDASGKATSAPEQGHFRTAPSSGRPVRIAWSADVVGQGWGIDTARGGMRLFRTMADANPDLFIHVGDTIYADNPLAESVTLDDGTIWKNIVTPAKSKVAETLDEFRGAHLYNRLDAHYRRFQSEVAMVAMWDDHEIRNNWFHAEVLRTDDRYTEKSVRVLAARARQAFLEHYPVTMDRRADAVSYRSIPCGPLVDVFALDMRSYRASNSDNMQTAAGGATAFLGDRQVRWLADALTKSTATWKVIAADMPLGLVVPHNPGEHDAVANGDNGPARGRELEIAGLLQTLKERNVRNVIWITGDVHFCAAHRFDPERAASRNFNPFWEFIAGPAHAGTFSAGEPDLTFGLETKFKGVPQDLKPNRPPSDGLQFFGLIEADPRSKQLTVALINTAGTRVFEQHLDAQ